MSQMSSNVRHARADAETTLALKARTDSRESQTEGEELTRQPAARGCARPRKRRYSARRRRRAALLAPRKLGPTGATSAVGAGFWAKNWQTEQS